MAKLSGKLAGWIGLLVVDLIEQREVDGWVGGDRGKVGWSVVDAEVCPVWVWEGWHLALDW